MANTRQLKKMGATMERAAGNPKASPKAKSVGNKAAKIQAKGFVPGGAGKAASKKEGAVTSGQVKQYNREVKKTK